MRGLLCCNCDGRRLANLLGVSALRLEHDADCLVELELLALHARFRVFA